MKSIEMILAIVVTISFLLKVSFMSRRMQLVVALVYGVFACFLISIFTIYQAKNGLP